MVKKPYNERTDIERLEAQWTKLSGLLERSDWSAAVVRAATATEIAVNFAIRKEFEDQSEIKGKSVDLFLKAANGLQGKVDKLLLPLVFGTPKYAAVTALKKQAETINSRRNKIVHSGEFSNADEANSLITTCKAFVEGIVRLYKPTFTLRDPDCALTR